MPEPNEALASLTASLPAELAQALGDLDAESVMRLIVLLKATEQRAHSISVEIARLMAKMGVPLPVIPPELC